MKFLHIQFTSQYTEGMTYQENQLPPEMVKLGHEVYFWGTCIARVNSELRNVQSEEKRLEDGVILRRFPYVRILNDLLTNKLKYVSGIYEELEKLNPDMIMVHDFQTMSGHAIVKYVKDHPHVQMVADSHTDKYNSARNVFSKYILHKMLFRPIAKKIQKYSKKIYYLSAEVKEFLLDIYKMDEYNLSLLPLGGNLLDEKTYQFYREKRRKELGMEKYSVLVMHSGKLDKGKRTKDLLDAFREIEGESTILIIIGKLMDDTEKAIKKAADNDSGDKRIRYLGWKTGRELIEYLCAADIYVQPGTPSATLQNAACCRCAIITYPHVGYQKEIMKDSALYAANKEELGQRLKELIMDTDSLTTMKKRAEIVACTLLDYGKQAKTICQIYNEQYERN